MKKQIGGVQKFLEKHKRRISPLLFLGGFIFDLFTLTQVDLLFDNMILLGHLVIITISIFLIHLGKREQVFSNLVEKMIMFAPFTLVFSFGGILSGYVIFYTKSASLIANWPFLVALYLLFLTSEVVFHRYQQTLFQIGMWFAATLSFCIFFVPIVIKALGPWIFILSNIISIFIGWLFAHLLIEAYPPLKARFAFIKTMFLSISLGFIILYFFNIIPPIPLSMKEIDVYHQVYRDESNQLVGLGQEYPWYQEVLPGKEVQIVPGNPVFVYNSIYSPAGIDTQIRHVWEYKDQNGEWVENNVVLYTLQGGRTDGFRWYSFNSPFSGEWRVLSTTVFGQEIGRTVFTIDHVSTTPKLIEETL